MDFHLKQWRNQQYESEEEEQNHSAKIPKLLNTNHNNNPNAIQFKRPESPSGSVLPLFVHNHHHQPQLNSTNKITTHLSPPPRMGSSYFSLAQWQELELQALIFRYMVAGATVPVELLSPIKKSLTTLLNTPPYFPLQQYYQPPALFQSGYWGRAAMDPEPGRCRRTDGKKWRCSRDVVVGQKYCERHMHRGRHRSRKPVETPTLTAAAVGRGGTHSAVTGRISGAGGDNATSIDLLRLGRSSPERKIDDGSGDTKSEGHVLRHFFDDWPRSRQECDNIATNGSSLSILMPGNFSSDISLKLSTGDADGPRWGSSPMGGPLAEALRTSSSNSPTSVLHQVQPVETCIVGS